MNKKNESSKKEREGKKKIKVRWGVVLNKIFRLLGSKRLEGVGGGVQRSDELLVVSVE